MISDSHGSPAPARFEWAGCPSIVPGAVSGSKPEPAPDSERVAEARARAHERLHRQRQTLRPLGLAFLLVVVLGSANGHPAPGLHGKDLGITLALCLFAVTLLVAIRDGYPDLTIALQATVLGLMGASGVAIAGLQTKGASEVAAGAAVFMAITRLPFRGGVAMGAAITAALAAVTAIAGGSSSAVAAGLALSVR